MSGFLIRSLSPRTRSACGAKNYTTAHMYFSIRKMNKDNKIWDARFVQVANPLRGKNNAGSQAKSGSQPAFYLRRKFSIFLKKSVDIPARECYTIITVRGGNRWTPEAHESHVRPPAQEPHRTARNPIARYTSG